MSIKIKLNEQIISIAPYISTHWSHVLSLHTRGEELVITLRDGSSVAIPGLKKETLHLIFQYHATYLSKEHHKDISSQVPIKLEEMLQQGEGASIKFAFGSSLEELGTMMQHNPNQKDAPNLPAEILQKIEAITKMIPVEDLILPKAEPDCNCFHCQIAGVINPVSLPVVPEESGSEAVNDEDLQFPQWMITQTGDKLFSVVNSLNEQEKYNVFLGEPIGCTCGKNGCEHILAVLKT